MRTGVNRANMLRADTQRAAEQRKAKGSQTKKCNQPVRSDATEWKQCRTPWGAALLQPCGRYRTILISVQVHASAVSRVQGANGLPSTVKKVLLYLAHIH